MQHLYEKLNLFYLGREEKSKQHLVYENKNLSTHALIVGMTGSGKTGLGIGLLEEATIDNIPSFIIDPKGDMGNLLLTFPNFSAEEFALWVDEKDPNKIASTWKKGIEDFDQDAKRVSRLKESGDFTIYTPGSSVGVEVALMSDFIAPKKEIMQDEDLLHSIINSTITSILGLIDVKSDPISGKEHILLSSILMHFFSQSKDVSLEDLIGYIVSPPFEKVGFFALEQFFSQEERTKLAMRLNSVIASPSFSSYLKGISLNIEDMLFTKEGKAKVNIFSISHLNDKQRMFFVTLFLNRFLAWMRVQEGSSSLRVLLYMDEIFGFFPPNQNPPSKLPMLTLLKQARAFGVGVVLSTQNPIDIDYKGLSNIGTWFIGRLQTAQDKQRVIDGLVGVQGSKLSKSELLELLSSIKKRHFLLKNIHQEGLHVFCTRWTLSYLKGPLNKDQIAFLMQEKKGMATQKNMQKTQKNKTQRRILQNDIKEQFLYYSDLKEPILSAFLLCKAKVNFTNRAKNIEQKSEFCYKIPILDEKIDWENKENFTPSFLAKEPKNGSSFASLPSFVDDDFKSLLKEFADHVYHNEQIFIQECKELKLFSSPQKSDEAFMSEMKKKLADFKNEEMQKLEKSYAKMHENLENKLELACRKLDKEQSDVGIKTTNTIINVGTSILGAIFGGKLFSSSNISKISSGVRGARGIYKEKQDVKIAKENIQAIEEKMENLRQELQSQIVKLDEKYDIKNFQIDKISIKPRRADIYDLEISILWEEE